jgi:hypothetical protein
MIRNAKPDGFLELFKQPVYSSSTTAVWRPLTSLTLTA